METCRILLLMRNTLSENLLGLFLHMLVNNKCMLINSSVVTYNHLSVSVWTVLDLFGSYSHMLVNSDQSLMNSDLSPVNSDLSSLSVRESILSCLAYLFVYQSISA